MVFYLIQSPQLDIWTEVRALYESLQITLLSCASRQTPEVAQWPFTVPRSQAVGAQWVHKGGVHACAW